MRLIGMRLYIEAEVMRQLPKDMNVQPDPQSIVLSLNDPQTGEAGNFVVKLNAVLTNEQLVDLIRTSFGANEMPTNPDIKVKP